MTGNDAYRESADKTLRAFASKMGAQPTAMPQMLVALMRHISPPQQIVLAGDDLQPFLTSLSRKFLPHHTLLKAGDVPATKEMTPVNGKPAAYVCENFTCQLPETDAGKLLVENGPLLK
jgi:uncharacterized protein YyaL (SSP411 family)